MCNFDVALANWYGEPPSLCVHSEMCGLAVALEPPQQAFGRDKSDSLPQYCLDCYVRFACRGGCPKDRFTDTLDGRPGLNYLCPSYREFFAHIRPAMADMTALLKAGAAPALMPIYAAEDAARGRNEPCTCMSGKKWKACHGR